MVDYNDIIGGEFAIDPQDIQAQNVDVYTLNGVYKYSSGRSALYYVLLDIKVRYGLTKVLFPDYLCSSVIVAANKAGMEIVFYELNDQLKIDQSVFSNIYDEKYAVLIINYFGLQDTSDDIAFVQSLNNSAVIIEDDVQAFYEFRKDVTLIDYKFTSLRKTFACPDGGLVKTKYNLPIISDVNKFYQYKMAGSILKSLRKKDYYDDDVFIHLLEKGEGLIDNDINKGISDVSVNIIANSDVESISNVRRKNAQIIIDGLNSLGIKPILPLMENKIPLFIPIYIAERNAVRKNLFKHNVFCPVHWPLDGFDVKKGREMSQYELSIIVDQRYGKADMQHILEIIEQSIK